MRVEVTMPQLGESIVEGTVVEWHKKVGDAVKKDEELLTISTDKVDAGVPCPQDGVLVELRANPDDVVEVGDIVAVIDTEGSAGANADDGSAPEEEKATDEKPAAAAPETSSDAVANEEDDGAEDDADTSGVRVTPVARKLLEEAGISDYAAVPGTGVGGKVLKKDVEAYLADGGDKKPAATQDDKGEVKRGNVDAGPTEAANQQYKVSQRPPSPMFSIPMSRRQDSEGGSPLTLSDDDRVVPMSRSRIAVAANLTHARRTAAHCATVWEADVTDIVRLRKELSPEYERSDVYLTYTPFFMAAVSSALRAHPILNAATDGENIVYRQAINLGIASAWNDALIVPTVKNADRLSLLGLARAVGELHERLNEGELKPADFEPATFTVTNSGVLGAKYGVPTLFPPQVGIMSIGSIHKRVVVGDDDSLRIRSMVNLCLAFDHRVVDFNDADGFMKKVVAVLEGGDW